MFLTKSKKLRRIDDYSNNQNYNSYNNGLNHVICNICLGVALQAIYDFDPVLTEMCILSCCETVLSCTAVTVVSTFMYDSYTQDLHIHCCNSSRYLTSIEAESTVWCS